MNNSAFLSVVLMLAVLTGGCGKGPDKTGPSQEATPRAEEAIGNEKLKVNVTFNEFQRLVYSSHVLTVIDAKPELEGSLLALLELQRQNPEANSTSLVKPVRRALEEYRKEASSHTLPVTWRDEVLGRYFLKLCEDPYLPERRQVALELLKALLAEQDASQLLGQQAVWFDTGGQRLLAVASGPGERQALVESCTRRAQSDANFAAAIDDLLRPEVGVALDAPPRDILAKNEALAQSPTMQELMRLSSSSKDGSPAITMDKLEDLFAAELTAMRDAVRTGQALHREIGRAQEDLAKYPDNATRVAAMIQQHAKELAGQRKRIAAANATAMQLSNLALPIDSKKGSQWSAIASNVFTIAAGALTIGASLAAEPLTLGASTLGVLAGATTIAAGTAGLVPSLDGDTEGMTKDEMMLHAIKLVGDMISDLSEQVDYRFDRVDRALGQTLRGLSSAVLLIGEVGHDVKQVRIKLLETQASLNRLERELHSYLIVGFGRELVEHINGDLGYQARTGFPLAYEDYVDTYGPENAFHTWAVHHARDRLASPMPDPEDLEDVQHVPVSLERPLERNLNYIKKFLEQRLGVSSLPDGPVASLADWYAGANAYLRLAAENPQHFRSMPGSQERLDDVIQAGTELEDFFRAITFVKSGPDAQVNRELYDAVVDYYKAKLDAFHKAVDDAEKKFRPDEDFDVSMWRKWEARVPRIPVAETAVIGGSCFRRFPIDIVGIAAGGSHSLAIRANGTVVAWGGNWYGQCNVPEGLADVVAVSAGAYHSLALKKDGTIVPWGEDRYGQFKIPEHKPVTKICVAPHHSLALDEDGRVIGWGNNSHGACEVPDDALTGVIDIAATGIANYDLGDISLALKADGTVVTWGRQWKEPDSRDTAKVPHGLSNVVAIAAGYGRVVAVKADGTVVGWPKAARGGIGDPYVRDGVTGVGAVALGRGFTLALKKDGGLEVIAGSLEGTPQTGGFVAIAAGGSHALALRDDGTVVAWGMKRGGACGLGDGTHMPVDIASSDFFLMEDGRATSLIIEVPSDLGPVVAIARGERAISSHIFSPYYLALRPDGNVRAWGTKDTFKQWNVPKDLSGVVAIAAGGEHGHCLALRRDGTVEAWGDNSSGQCNVPQIPEGLNAVAVAAGPKRSLALRADGTVVAWGDKSYKACNVPEGLDNVVAIAAGRYHNLALKADGTVVGWGEDKHGVCKVPPGLTGIVAIAAGEERSLALKADGTVAAWGRNDKGQCDFAAALTGVLAMAATGDSFLVSPTTPSIENTEPLPFMRGEPPPAVMHRLRAVCADVLSQFDPDLKDSLNQLTGAKFLLESVVALGLPNSLDQDDVLRGFLFGSEALIDREGARALYEAEHKRLHTDEWRRRASTLEETPTARLESFHRRLDERLNALEDSGTPEIPRMVGHTLLQLRLLRAAY